MMIQRIKNILFLIVPMGLVQTPGLISAHYFDAVYEQEDRNVKSAREDYERYITETSPVLSTVFGRNVFNPKAQAVEGFTFGKGIDKRLNNDQKRNAYRILRDINSKMESKINDYLNGKIDNSDERERVKKEILQQAREILHQVVFYSADWEKLIKVLLPATREATAEKSVSDINYILSENIDLLAEVGLDPEEGQLFAQLSSMIESNVEEYYKLGMYVYNKDSKSEVNEYFAQFLVSRAIGMIAVKKELQEDIGFDDVTNKHKYAADCQNKMEALKFYASVDIKKKCELLEQFHSVVLYREEVRVGWLEAASDIALPGLVIAGAYAYAASHGYIAKDSPMICLWNWFEKNFKTVKPQPVA